MSNFSDFFRQKKKLDGKLHQLFFVSKDRGTFEELEALNVLISVFGKNVLEHTCVVRTNCSQFRNSTFITQEETSLKTGFDQKYSEIFQNARKILFVNNVSLKGAYGQAEIENAQLLQQYSRKIIVDYLQEVKDEADYPLLPPWVIHGIIARREKEAQEKEPTMVEELQQLFEKTKLEVKEHEMMNKELEKLHQKEKQQREILMKNMENKIKDLERQLEAAKQRAAARRNSGGGGGGGCTIL